MKGQGTDYDIISIRLKVEKEIVEATNGSARISWGEKVLYALIDKKIEIFEKNT